MQHQCWDRHRLRHAAGNADPPTKGDKLDGAACRYMDLGADGFRYDSSGHGVTPSSTPPIDSSPTTPTWLRRNPATDARSRPILPSRPDYRRTTGRQLPNDPEYHLINTTTPPVDRIATVPRFRQSTRRSPHTYGPEGRNLRVRFPKLFTATLVITIRFMQANPKINPQPHAARHGDQPARMRRK